MVNSGKLYYCIGKFSKLSYTIKNKDEHSHEKKMSAETDRARLAKWSKSLMNEGFRELKWTCPLCSSESKLHSNIDIV